MSWRRLSKRIVKKTRKPSICVWCGEEIEVGSSTIVITGIWDDLSDREFQANRFHEECHPVAHDYCNQRDAYEGFEEHAGIRGYPCTLNGQCFYEKSEKCLDCLRFEKCKEEA